jgi:alcohol dehydrogenase YqhD (iron-dependent ADH family)
VKDFIFTLPVQVFFGKNSLKRLPEILPTLGKRCLLVYGRSQAKRVGVYEKLVQSLKSSNIEFQEFSGIKSNPPLSKVKEGIRFAQDFKPDFLIALGGGSVIDTAKALACGYFYSGDLWDFFEMKATPEKALPIVAIPTIAGSGSELNDVSVIVNEDLGLKLSIRHPSLLPKYTFIDPSLTYTVPQDLTAYGVMDAFSHCFEFYHFSKHFTESLPFDLAVLFMKRLIHWGKVAFVEPENYDVRANIFWISSLALSGVIRSGVGAYRFFLHSLEHPLSGLFDTPHGLNLAILMASYLRLYHRNQRVRKFFSDVFGIEGGDLSKRGLEALLSLYEYFKLPLSLKEIGLSSQDIPALVERACKILFLWKAEEELTKEDVEKVYALALEGPFG